MEYTLSDLANLSADEIIRMLANTPETATSLLLRNNDLGKRDIADLEKILHAIPSHINSLDLSSNHFDSKSGVQLAGVFTFIPVWIRSFSFGDNNLYSINSTELAYALSSLPGWINLLNLGFNNLGEKPADELIVILAAIPITVFSLGLAINNLNKLPALELARVITQLPKGVHLLDLFNNNLSKIDGDLTPVFAAISLQVTGVDLSCNQLGLRRTEELIQAFATLSSNLNYFNLGNNKLGHKTTEELVQLISRIPNNVTYLDLSNNKLDNYWIFSRHRTPEEFAQIFAAISDRVTLLDFSDNGFGDYENSSFWEVWDDRRFINYGKMRSPEEFAQNFVITPRLSSRSDFDSIKAFALMPEYRITLIGDFTIRMTNEFWANCLNEKIRRLGSHDLCDMLLHPIIPPIDLDFERIPIFIEILERKATASAYLTCGLLLEGRIKTVVKNHDTKQQSDAYKTARLKQAIQYYFKVVDLQWNIELMDCILFILGKTTNLPTVRHIKPPNKPDYYVGSLVPNFISTLKSCSPLDNMRGFKYASLGPILDDTFQFNPSRENYTYIDINPKFITPEISAFSEIVEPEIIPPSDMADSIIEVFTITVTTDDSLIFDQEFMPFNTLAFRLCEYIKKQLATNDIYNFPWSIRPNVVIYKEELQEIIEALVQIDNSIAYFTCGLLLEGRIETWFIKDDEDQNNEELVIGIRELEQAINYYQKAASDPELFRFIDVILFKLATRPQCSRHRQELMKKSLSGFMSALAQSVPERYIRDYRLDKHYNQVIKMDGHKALYLPYRVVQVRNDFYDTRFFCQKRWTTINPEMCHSDQALLFAS